MNRKRFQKVAILTAICCLLMALLAGCGNTANTIIEALRAGNATQANELYSSKVLSNAKEETKFSEAFTAELQKVYDSLNSGSITFHDANNLVDAYNCFDGAYSYADLINQISSLSFSKEMFESAEQDMENKDYITAIFAYTSVLKDDANRSTALERKQEAYDLYITAALEQAETLAAAEDYAAALDALDLARSELENSVAVTYGGELDAKLEEYTMLQTASEIAKFTDAAEALQASGDYSGAMAKIQEGLTEHPDNAALSDALLQTQRDYANATLDDAASRFTANQDYAGAMAVLEVAAADMLDEDLQALLQRAHDYYQAFEPVLIGELEPFYNEGNTYLRTTKDDAKYYRTDNAGNTYDSVYWVSSNDPDDYAVYRVSDYDTFTCTVFVPSKYKNENCGKVEIYLDGNLAYQSPDMGVGSYPAEVTLELNNAAECKICYSGLEYQKYDMYSWAYTSCYLGNATLSKSTVNAAAFSERA